MFVCIFCGNEIEKVENDYGLNETAVGIDIAIVQHTVTTVKTNGISFFFFGRTFGFVRLQYRYKTSARQQPKLNATTSEILKAETGRIVNQPRNGKGGGETLNTTGNNNKSRAQKNTILKELWSW